MEVTIKRLQFTNLYTLGVLYVNGNKKAYTVESSNNMLEEGDYQIQLRNGNRRRQIAVLAKQASNMPVANMLCHFEAGGSWITAKKNMSICLGNKLIAGALKEGTILFERLFDCIEKVKGQIKLSIISDGITYGTPIKHWLLPVAV